MMASDSPPMMASDAPPTTTTMAADTAHHRRCYLCWPHREDTWRDGAGPVRRAFAEVARAIATSEDIIILARPSDAAGARAALASIGNAEVVPMELDDAWVRDTGPTFLVDSTAGALAAGVDWKFNAWGGACFTDCARDDAVASVVLARLGVPRVDGGIVMEGGALHTDGEGTLLVTEECLLCPNRNPALDKAAIERALIDKCGVDKVCWLPFGLHGDTDTNGHVDNVACFAAPATVLLAWEEDPDDPQHERSAANLAALEAARDARGRPFRVIKLPQPPPVVRRAEEAAGVAASDDAKARLADERLAASYVNAYVGNGVVVAPRFGHADADAKAAAVLAEAYPGREVVGVDAREVLLGGGGIHCITLGEPV